MPNWNKVAAVILYPIKEFLSIKGIAEVLLGLVEYTLFITQWFTILLYIDEPDVAHGFLRVHFVVH